MGASAFACAAKILPHRSIPLRRRRGHIRKRTLTIPGIYVYVDVEYEKQLPRLPVPWTARLNGGVFLKIFTQLGIIFGICLVSDVISRLLPFSLPVSIIGMLLLLAMLCLRLLKPRQIETTADFFLANLPFFFVPAIVGLINYLDLLRENAVKMFIVTLVS